MPGYRRRSSGRFWRKRLVDRSSRARSACKGNYQSATWCSRNAGAASAVCCEPRSNVSTDWGIRKIVFSVSRATLNACSTPSNYETSAVPLVSGSAGRASRRFRCGLRAQGRSLQQLGQPSRQRGLAVGLLAVLEDGDLAERGVEIVVVKDQGSNRGLAFQNSELAERDAELDENSASANCEL